MAKQLQLRRGTTAQHATFTGAVGEVTIDTDKDVVVVHDGATVGGFPSQKQLVSGTNIKSINGSSILTSGNLDLVTKISSIEGLASLGSSTPTVIVTDTDRGGIFVWSASGTANGGTVFAGSSGYWVRQYSGAVNVKWFGAKGDGVTDDTITIQNALDLKLGTYIFPIGQYRLNSISLDIAYNSIVGENTRTIFDFTNSTDTDVLLITSSVASNYKAGKGLYGVVCKAGSSHNVIVLGTSQGNIATASNFTLEDCIIDGGNRGIEFRHNSYITKVNRTDFIHFTTAIYSDGTYSNTGENIGFTNCTFANGESIVDVTGSGHDVFFTGCSFDYCSYIFKKISTVNIFLSQCHIEYNHNNNYSFCNIIGNNGALVISNSTLFAGDGSTDKLGYCDSGRLTIIGSKLHAFGNTVSGDYLIETTANSKVNSYLNTFLNIDLINKGLCSYNLFSNGLAYIADDVAVITKNRTGTNIILANGANSDELTITKTYGGGSNSSFVIYFPLKSSSRVKITVKLLESSTWTGNSYWTFGIAGTTHIEDTGLLRLSQTKAQGTGTISSYTTIGTLVSSYISTESLQKSDYAYILVNANNVDGHSGGTLKLKITAYGI